MVSTTRGAARWLQRRWFRCVRRGFGKSAGRVSAGMRRMDPSVPNVTEMGASANSGYKTKRNRQHATKYGRGCIAASNQEPRRIPTNTAPSLPQGSPVPPVGAQPPLRAQRRRRHAMQPEDVRPSRTDEGLLLPGVPPSRHNGRHQPGWLDRHLDHSFDGLPEPAMISVAGVGGIAAAHSGNRSPLSRGIVWGSQSWQARGKSPRL